MVEAMRENATETITNEGLCEEEDMAPCDHSAIQSAK